MYKTNENAYYAFAFENLNCYTSCPDRISNIEMYDEKYFTYYFLYSDSNT